MSEQRLNKIYKRIKQNSDSFLGYPLAKDFSYKKLAPFLDICINNIGDPEVNSTLTIDTKDIEREVVDFFKEILSANLNEVWGYITNGGTESNLYGLYVAREYFPKAIVYYSEATHYSVKKNIHLLNLKSIVVRSQENGEIDYKDLDLVISSNRSKPAIFFLNIGTTMTEAIDDLDEIKIIIKRYAIKDYYIHCDAAFLGAISPFMNPKPKFDFAEGVDSIAISGHKFIGGPIPCGIALVKRKHRDRIANSISYIGTLDTTISGSRNGLTPLFLWGFLQEKGKNGLIQRAKNCQEVAIYTEEVLKAIGIKAWRFNSNSLTVVLPKVSEETCSKYNLASQGDISHIICMPGIEKSHINELVNDLKKEKDIKKKETKKEGVQKRKE